MEFTMELANMPKETMEEIRKMAEAPDSFDICIPNGEQYVKVATITREKDCPKELFNKVMKQLIQNG